MSMRVTNGALHLDAQTIRLTAAEIAALVPSDGPTVLPVPPGLYRWHEATDEKPWIPYGYFGSRFVYRVNADQSVECQVARGVEWTVEKMPSGILADIRAGRRVPYTPPPAFAVGEWVVALLAAYLGAMRIRRITGDVLTCETASGHVFVDMTRRFRSATPEEIAVATRITPKVGMLVRRHRDNRVLRIQTLGATTVEARILSDDGGSSYMSPDSLTTTAYTVLDRYIIEGVR